MFKGTFSLKKIFALDLRLSEVVDDDFYLSWVVRLAIALVARYCELIHERFVALDPRLEVFSRSLWRAVGKVKERQLLLGVSSNFKFFHDDDFLFTEFKFRKFCPTRPEGAEALSPGQRPGLFWAVTCRPVRAKALKLLTIYKAFALTGRLADCYYTQGDALG